MVSQGERICPLPDQALELRFHTRPFAPDDAVEDRIAQIAVLRHEVTSKHAFPQGADPFNRPLGALVPEIGFELDPVCTEDLEAVEQRRAATSWVDGLFVPNYTLGDQGAGGGLLYGDGSAGGGGTIAPTAGLNIATSEDKGHGFTGISLRPNAYVWRYLGEQTILAPLNASREGYPQDPKRNFGFSGLSVASDRWDVRWAVIIEGALRITGSDIRTVEIWIDYQTQQPLYWITRTNRRRLLDIGILLHRFTGDIRGYPEWPGGVPANIFEPVGASFYSAISGGGGWRRESYDLLSTPFRASERRVMTSADNLGKGR